MQGETDPFPISSCSGSDYKGLIALSVLFAGAYLISELLLDIWE